MAPAQTRLLMGMGTVLVLLVGVLVWGEAPERSPPGEPEWRAAADTLAEAELVRVTVDEADDAVVLVRVEGTWRLAHPYDARADEARSSSLVAALQGLEVSAPLGRTDGAPYGLDPGTRVEGVLSTQETLRVWVGSEAPTGRGTYLRMDDGSIRLSKGPIRDRLVLAAADLRSRTVVDVSPAGVTSVRAASPTEEGWTLRRDEEAWWLSDATGTDRADAEAVHAFLSSLEALEVDTFVDGLGHLEPTWTVVLDTLDGPRTVVLGAGAGEARMVQGSELSQPALVRLPPSLAALDPARFRAQAVLSFALADLRSFEVGLGAHTLSAVRTQEGWPSADLEATAAALRELTGDRRRPVPDPVGQAWGRVAVVRDGQGPQAVAFFQQHGAGRVAVDPEGGDPFWVAQEDLDALAASAR